MAFVAIFYLYRYGYTTRFPLFLHNKFFTMKRIFILVFVFFITNNLIAQIPTLKVFEFKLPKEIEWYDNQFSGLYIYEDKLYLLSESRLQDNAEAKLYSFALDDLQKQKTDTNYVLPFTKIPIMGLDMPENKMNNEGNKYEGLESFAIINDQYYFLVETNTPSPDCILLQGVLQNGLIVMSDIFKNFPKPRLAGGKPVYNAGFEAMNAWGTDSYVKGIALYEYNYFNRPNYAYTFSRNFSKDNDFVLDSIKLKTKIPFRITDITKTGKNKYTAINFFYKGSGPDEVYRVPQNDKNFGFTQKKGEVASYSRLVEITVNKRSVEWKPIAEFPEKYWAYNWEGIAAYKNGYFIINDKYTPARPYKTTLLFVSH